jgi:hypothetical protein
MFALTDVDNDAEDRSAIAGLDRIELDFDREFAAVNARRRRRVCRVKSLKKSSWPAWVAIATT